MAKYRPYTVADFEAKLQCFHIHRDVVTPVEVIMVARLLTTNRAWFKYPSGYVLARNIEDTGALTDSLYVETEAP